MSVWRDASISIAEDLFFVALDERSGRVRLHPRAHGLGLAAALLAELALIDQVTYVDGRLVVPPGTTPPDAVHLAQMRDHLLAEPQHPLSTWLAFFAQTAPEVVAARVVARGFLRRESTKSLLRTKESFAATDESALAWRALRLANLIGKRDVRSWEDAVLIALVDVTGLAETVLWHGAASDLDNLATIVARVGEDPLFNALTTQVSASIAAGVMTR